MKELPVFRKTAGREYIKPQSDVILELQSPTPSTAESIPRSPHGKEIGGWFQFLMLSSRMASWWRKKSERMYAQPCTSSLWCSISLSSDKFLATGIRATTRGEHLVLHSSSLGLSDGYYSDGRLSHFMFLSSHTTLNRPWFQHRASLEEASSHEHSVIFIFLLTPPLCGTSTTSTMSLRELSGSIHISQEET